ncbi:unnamed protein product [Paramecium octaurelia]|uniref:Uncharacterized protein n=1 Tax=Paramecium octaurelia TaxID=43137 RepID=A0A8S1STR4_PAROT|nr:unnamed protein product [Paramecium octaurelia]
MKFENSCMKNLWIRNTYSQFISIIILSTQQYEHWLLQQKEQNYRIQNHSYQYGLQKLNLQLQLKYKSSNKKVIIVYNIINTWNNTVGANLNVLLISKWYITQGLQPLVQLVQFWIESKINMKQITEKQLYYQNEREKIQNLRHFQKYERVVALNDMPGLCSIQKIFYNLKVKFDTISIVKNRMSTKSDIFRHSAILVEQLNQLLLLSQASTNFLKGFINSTQKLYQETTSRIAILQNPSKQAVKQMIFSRCSMKETITTESRISSLNVEDNLNVVEVIKTLSLTQIKIQYQQQQSQPTDGDVYVRQIFKKINKHHIMSNIIIIIIIIKKQFQQRDIYLGLRIN